MRADSGEVIFSKNADKKLSMASTTKIMTSLLALEAAVPNTEITVTDEMVRVEGTSMGLQAGDSVSMNELVYGMLLQSGNDAANTVAYVLSGSPEDFSERMNDRAKQIGMNNSNFVTASGLDDENHYSTAYDMALLARECMANPEFASICVQKSARLTYGNPPYARTLTNHNRLLWLYGDTIGIKTGFTKKSGRCLVSAAERNGVMLIAVTLNAPDDWNDHISMFEYGFSKIKGALAVCDLSEVKLNIVGGTKRSVSAQIAEFPYWISGENCYAQILINPVIYAPVEKNDIVGVVRFMNSDGDIVAESSVFASESVERIRAQVTNDETVKKNNFSELIRHIKEFFGFSEVK